MTPYQHIRKRAERLYPAYLRSLICSETFFPKEIRIAKPAATSDYATLTSFYEEILKYSKQQQPFGYSITQTKRKTRLYGEQTLLHKVTFESEDNYLHFLKKNKEVQVFKENLEHVRQIQPGLLEWLARYPQRLIDHSSEWKEILHVCGYFSENLPNALYLRQIPVEVHTKFIEERKKLFTELFNIIIPHDRINHEGETFEERFMLKSNEGLIRFRLLDSGKSKEYGLKYSDMSVPLSEFQNRPLDPDVMIITENKMCFLALPEVSNAIAIWGEGFHVSALKNIPWLTSCRIIYWGDIDAHGFQILSQLRGYYPQTVSLMMNQETLESFKQYSVQSPAAQPAKLANLTSAEYQLYENVLDNRMRLEQEKLPQRYCNEQTYRMVASMLDIETGAKP